MGCPSACTALNCHSPAGGSHIFPVILLYAGNHIDGEALRRKLHGLAGGLHGGHGDGILQGDLGDLRHVGRAGVLQVVDLHLFRLGQDGGGNGHVHRILRAGLVLHPLGVPDLDVVGRQNRQVL